MPIPTPLSPPVQDNPHKPSPSLPFKIEIFPSSSLLNQPFLPELKEVINTSYADHVSKYGLRLQSNTQIVSDIGEKGFTAVATTTATGSGENEIVGTASVKPWGSSYSASASGEMVWRPAGWYEGVRADQVASQNHGQGYESEVVGGEWGGCEGDYEIMLVAVKTGGKYRKKGIAEGVVRACEEEIRRRVMSGSDSGSGVVSGKMVRKTSVRVMLKVVREINGEYWTKKGFRVAGECYCPPYTWDIKVAFVLWAMWRELVVG